MLSIKNIVVHYGGVEALKGVSLEAAEGRITTLIGANGAGKSTTLRAVSGMVHLTTGEIWFGRQRIDGLSPEEIVEMGIGHVPEGKKLFLEMSVRDNLLTGAYLRRDKKEIERDIEMVCAYFPVLQRAYHRPAAQMSGGEQQMLAIARGLMSAPRFLMLDEPSLGLSPLLTQEVGGIVKRIADQEGVSILLIEQNASLALRLARRCYVLETGRVVLEGDSEELRDNRHVKAAYLGVDPDLEPPEAALEGAEAGPVSGRSEPRSWSADELPEKEYSRPKRDRLPPENPPVLTGSWDPRPAGAAVDRWTRGDPDPSSLRPKNWREPERADRTAERSPEPPEPRQRSRPVVIKKVFRP